MNTCILLLLCGFFLAACNGNPTEEEYIARVGDRTLTMEEVQNAFETITLQQDSSETMQQIVEGWIKDELIAQQAIREGLRNDAEVQRLLAETERQVLVSAFITKLFEENSPEPTDEEIESYYAQNVDQLVLRDDYLRVRYLSSPSAEEANEVRILLRDATVAGNADSLWPSIVGRFALEPDVSLTLSSEFYPSAILFSYAQLNDIVNRLEVNQISEVVEEGNAYHVVQLVEKRPSGAIPELSWIREELKQRLIIDARKQMVARQVQRLRTEALAQEDLEIRYLDE